MFQHVLFFTGLSACWQLPNCHLPLYQISGLCWYSVYSRIATAGHFHCNCNLHQQSLFSRSKTKVDQQLHCSNYYWRICRKVSHRFNFRHLRLESRFYGLDCGIICRMDPTLAVKKRYTSSEFTFTNRWSLGNVQTPTTFSSLSYYFYSIFWLFISFECSAFSNQGNIDISVRVTDCFCIPGLLDGRIGLFQCTENLCQTWK